MPKKLADEDGNFLPELDPTSDVAKLIYLMEYARQRQFRLGTVQIGEVIVQVQDLKQARELSDDPRSPQLSIWQENGFDDSKG